MIKCESLFVFVCVNLCMDKHNILELFKMIKYLQSFKFLQKERMEEKRDFSFFNINSVESQVQVLPLNKCCVCFITTSVNNHAFINMCMCLMVKNIFTLLL